MPRWLVLGATWVVLAWMLLNATSRTEAQVPAPAGAGSSLDGEQAGGIPASLKPFEHLVGAWKGMAIPAANRLKGWPERHLWAWKFSGGKPVGLVISFEGSPSVKQAVLLPGDEPGSYWLEWTASSGELYRFVGTMDEKGRVLTLDREDGEARQRVALRLNSNGIRYTWIQEEQEPGAPQFSRVQDANLGKEGESFAAGGAASRLPECVLTGGAATMTVSYQGRSYPVCCTGCRDEFLAEPEKYVARAALKGQAGAEAPGADRPVFENEQPAGAEPGPASEVERLEAPETEAKAGENEARARTLLRLGQALERAGKTAAAVEYYRRILDKHPGTPSAGVAEARIQALEPG